MEKQHSHLIDSERNRLQRSLNQGMSLRAVARALGRSVSTISRECRRGGSRLYYDAVKGGAWARSHRRRGPRKLTAGSPLSELVGSKLTHSKCRGTRCNCAMQPILSSQMSQGLCCNTVSGRPAVFFSAGG